MVAYPFNLQTATPFPAGYTLINGTGTVLSWTAPNDGQLHQVIVYGCQLVTSNETGGAVDITFEDPTGGPQTIHALFSGHTTGYYTFGGSGDGSYQLLIPPGSTVSIVQTSALSAGAAVMWAKIWGS